MAGKFIALEDPEKAKKIDDKYKRKIEQELTKLPESSRFAVPGSGIRKEAVARIRQGSSRFRGCPSCGSRIATDYVSGVACPVCRSDDFGLTATDKKRLQKAIDKEKQVRGKCAELNKQCAEEKAQAAAKGKSKTRWVIAAICSY